jgi:acyl dehydratase
LAVLLARSAAMTKQGRIARGVNMPTYLDEFAVGQTASFGTYEVTRDEVLRFAAAFDPQPFHLDDDAAAANPIFGRLSASGWHTAAMTMRMIVDQKRASGHRTLASPGIDELRWLSPVYPGDTLRMETKIVEVRPSRSRPELGSVHTEVSAFNQHGDKVMQYRAIELVPTRSGTKAPAP